MLKNGEIEKRKKAGKEKQIELGWNKMKSGREREREGMQKQNKTKSKTKMKNNKQSCETNVMNAKRGKMEREHEEEKQIKEKKMNEKMLRLGKNVVENERWGGRGKDGVSYAFQRLLLLARLRICFDSIRSFFFFFTVRCFLSTFAYFWFVASWCCCCCRLALSTSHTNTQSAQSNKL